MVAWSVPRAGGKDGLPGERQRQEHASLLCGGFQEKGQLTQTEYDRIITLADQGANNTLIEFDTVINQMMFLMTARKVPEKNTFYAKLREVARQAYDRRHS